jgi:hypothetical protein
MEDPGSTKFIALLVTLLLVGLLYWLFNQRNTNKKPSKQDDHFSDSPDSGLFKAKPVGVRPPRAHVIKESIASPNTRINRTERSSANIQWGEDASSPHRNKTDYSTKKDWQEESPLVLMGYRVGKTKGLKESERRKILRKAFEDHIPNAYELDYMADWGTPRTRARYDRIVEHLAFMANSRSGQKNMDIAVSHWQSDLDWFKREFRHRLDQTT